MSESSSPYLRQVWFVLGVGFLVMFLASAIKGIYQIYFVDLADHFGKGRADFATSSALFMLVTGLVSPVVGALSDRLGPMRIVMMGSVCAGLVFVGMVVFQGSLGIFILLYGTLAAFALAAMTYVPMGVLVDRLVTDRAKAFAYAVVTNGTAVGFIVLAPLWVWLERDTAWQTVFLAAGFVFGVPLALGLHRVSKLVPDLELPRSTAAKGAWNLVVRDPRFYWLAGSFATCGATMAFIDVHLVPHWQDAHTARAVQASSLSLLGILELASGLAAGWLATRYNKGLLLCGFYLLRSLAMFTLLSDSQMLNTYGFAVLFGASYLGTVVLTSAFCFDFYGPAIKGQVFGTLFLIHQVGAFATAQLGGYDFDRHHSYELTVVVLAMATVAAGVLGALLATARTKQRAQPAS